MNILLFNVKLLRVRVLSNIVFYNKSIYNIRIIKTVYRVLLRIDILDNECSKSYFITDRYIRTVKD